MPAKKPVSKSAPKSSAKSATKPTPKTSAKATKKAARLPKLEDLDEIDEIDEIVGVIDEDLVDQVDSDSATKENNAQIGDVTNDAVRDYLRKISDIPLLTRQEEIDCSQRIAIGLYAKWKLENAKITSETKRLELEWLATDGEVARRFLVESNLRLAVSCARKYKGTNLQFGDLVQMGTEGLRRAAMDFNHKLGYRFSTYATPWVDQAIGRGIKNKGNFRRLPVAVIEQIGRLKRAHNILVEAYHREPTIDELAMHMEIPVEKVAELITWHKESTPVSSSGMMNSDGESVPWEDLIADESPDKNDVVTEKQRRDALKKVLNTLSENERVVIELRHGIYDGKEKTLEEVGNILNRTRESVRVIEKRAHAKLRHPPRQQMLKDYFL